MIVLIEFQIPAFYSVGRQGNKKPTGFSEKLWPINGGEWAPASCSYSEIILTGYEATFYYLIFTYLNNIMNKC